MVFGRLIRAAQSPTGRDGLADPDLERHLGAQVAPQHEAGLLQEHLVDRVRDRDVDVPLAHRDGDDAVPLGQLEREELERLGVDRGELGGVQGR